MERRCKVIYFSQTQHTETVAKEIAAQTGGELIRLKPIQPYPEAYRALVDRAQQEITRAFSHKSKIPTAIRRTLMFSMSALPTGAGRLRLLWQVFSKAAAWQGRSLLLV